MEWPLRDTVAELKDRIRNLRDQLDLAHHDIDEIYAAGERWRLKLLDRLDRGDLAAARAMIRWQCGRQP